MAISDKDFQAVWIVSLFFYSALAVAQPRQKITDFSGEWGGHFTFCHYDKKTKARHIIHSQERYVLQQKGNRVTGLRFDGRGLLGRLQGSIQKNKLISKECFENRDGDAGNEEATCPNYDFEGYFIKKGSRLIKYEDGGKTGYDIAGDMPYYIKLKKGQRIPIKRLGKCKPY